MANSTSDPPIASVRNARMNTPRLGSVANAWTDVSTPDAYEERAEEAQGERRDGEQHGPALERPPF